MKGQNDAMPVMTMVYGDHSGPRRRKNKPNSKPIKACPFGKLRAGSEQSRMGPIPAESAGKLAKLDVNETIGIPLRAI